jgi:hypothetical protein
MKFISVNMQVQVIRKHAIPSMALLLGAFGLVAFLQKKIPGRSSGESHPESIRKQTRASRGARKDQDEHKNHFVEVHSKATNESKQFFQTTLYEITTKHIPIRDSTPNRPPLQAYACCLLGLDGGHALALLLLVDRLAQHLLLQTAHLGANHCRGHRVHACDVLCEVVGL